MMSRWRKALAVASWLFISLAAACGEAQAAVDCTGVPAWSASATYRPGDRLQHQGKLYEALTTIWNAAPDYCPACGWYKLLGTCGAGGNTPPTVRITAPANGATFTAGSSITISASAQDSDGTVTRVEFFQGSTSLNVDTSSPFSYAWTNAAAGSYSLTAKATDNGGLTTTSAAVSITVQSPSACSTLPGVPSGLQVTGKSSSTVSLSWSAAAPGQGCTVQYRVYRDGAAVATTASTSYTATGLTPQTTYSFRVAAFNGHGSSAESGPVSATTDGASPGGKRLIGYFVQWGIYARAYNVKHIDTSGSAAKMTHLNYAFNNVLDNRCVVGVTRPETGDGRGSDAFADYTKSFGAAESVDGVGDVWEQPLKGNWNQLKKLKAKHPHLKVLISLGGWTWSRGFASAARPENRVAFVASCVDAYIKGNLPVVDGAGGTGAAAGVFDGIDLDWEYPVACGLTCGAPEDDANFTALLAEFRRQLDLVRPGLLVTVAAGAGIDKIRVTSPASYHRHLDFINVMTYDFHGGWDSTTNFHSPLYAAPDDPATGDLALYNSNDAIRAFLDRGVPASKLNLGIGFYGRGWTNVPNVNNGLYQSGGTVSGTYEAGNEDYKVLKNRGGASFRHDQAQAFWKYDGTTFWSYDDVTSVTNKMSYVKSRGLGGAFFWELSGDSNGELCTTMKNGLQ